MAKDFKSNIQKPTDEQLLAISAGRPFGTCRQCGLRTVAGQVNCPECERLIEIGFGPVPRSPYPLPGQDTTPVQSNDAFNHKGYKDTISNKKFDPSKERV
jgi:hypothetical protein